MGAKNPKADDVADAADPSGGQDLTFPPVADGDPAANPPAPLDDMPVAPLTEPTDVNGG